MAAYDNKLDNDKMKNELVLISYKGCPFVHRSEIFLEEAGLGYSIEYIDLSNKPDWFLKISPLGQVPVLKVGDKAIFDSVVINEFLDEFSGHQTLPKDILDKAVNRSWINYAEKLILNQGAMFVANTESKFIEEFEKLRQALAKVEGQLEGSSFFNGERFSLIDVSYAPFFMRFTYFNAKREYDVFAGLPKVAKWRDAILNHPSVKKTYKDDVAEYYNTYCKNVGAFFLA